MYVALYSKFPAESVSEIFFKIRLRFDKVTAKVWGLVLWITVLMIVHTRKPG